MRAYLSWPETGAPPDVTAAIRGAVSEAGHEPVESPRGAKAGVTKSERDAFLLAVDRLHEADILIAEASAASIAVGWETAWFLARGRLVIVCCHKEARGVLSHMLAGNPSPWQRSVLYDGVADLRERLAALLR